MATVRDLYLKFRRWGKSPIGAFRLAKRTKGDASCGGCGDCCSCLSALPDGKTCADCVHVERCVSMFGQKSTDTACQWIPSRALLKVSAAHGGTREDG